MRGVFTTDIRLQSYDLTWLNFNKNSDTPQEEKEIVVLLIIFNNWVSQRLS